MTCTRCGIESSDAEIWPNPEFCPDCWWLWKACSRYQQMKGGVDYEIKRFPHLCREIAIRANAPTPLLGFGRNGFYREHLWGKAG